MPPKSFVRLFGLALALPLFACAAYQAQHQPAKPPAVAQEIAPVSVRPEGEFSELRPDLQIARVKSELQEIKSNLAQQGAYSCCVEPPCTECLLRRGHCPCRDMVRKKAAACGECTQGWVEGRGIVEGVDAKEVVERRQKLNAQSNAGETPPPEHQHH
ncbi:MAG TPA: hypothetical protein VIC28_17620 [Thermoanaerobaculia bacterium]